MKNILCTLSLLLVASLGYSQLKVITTGEVGIGTTTPTEKLEVDGDIKSTGAIYEKTGGSATLLAERTDGAGFLIGAGGNCGVTFDKLFKFQFRRATRAQVQSKLLTVGSAGFTLIGADGKFGIGDDNPINKLHVKGGGYKTAGGDLWSIPSDRRLKDNIADFTDGLKLVMNMKPVSYRYNGKAGTSEGEEAVGVVAQDLEKIAPYMVEDAVYQNSEYVLDENGQPKEVYTGTEDIKIINMSALKYVLVNAIQEQQAQIEEKDERIAELENQMEAVMNAIDDLRINGLGDAGVQSEITLNSYDLASLNQNQPNPFNGYTMIDYIVPTDAQNAEIQIYDISGKLMKVFKMDHKGEGTLRVNAVDIPSGSYTYSMIVDGRQIDSKKMILAK